MLEPMQRQSEFKINVSLQNRELGGGVVEGMGSAL